MINQEVVLLAGTGRLHWKRMLAQETKTFIFFWGGDLSISTDNFIRWSVLTMKVSKNKGKMGEREIVKEKNGYYYNKMHIITFMEKENFM